MAESAALPEPLLGRFLDAFAEAAIAARGDRNQVLLPIASLGVADDVEHAQAVAHAAGAHERDHGDRGPGREVQ